MKILFFDIDGTLLVGDGISPECRAELERVKAMGNKLVINTGRSYGFTPGELRDDPLFDGFICGSAYVRYGGEVIENLCLSREILRSVVDWGKKSGNYVFFEGVSESFVMNGFQGLEDRCDEMLARETLPEITKVTFWCKPGEVPDGYFKGLRLVRFPYYAEGILEGRDKSSGMKIILEREGLTARDAWAFGDSENDRDMLRFAGNSVCMPGAPADFDGFCVYRALAKDGVPEALAKFF